jgi:hypothetical protein
VTAFRITYDGPQSFALEAARLLAEADGVELTASDPPSRRDDDSVVLALTVEATEEAVDGALDAIAKQLPRRATIRADAVS